MSEALSTDKRAQGKAEFYAKISEAVELRGDERREALKTIWGNEAAKYIKGRRIVEVRYMTEKEMSDLDFHSAGIVLKLDNGHCIFPSRDDEGNDSGALFTTFNEMHTVPVIS